jgi:hypothetical protein
MSVAHLKALRFELETKGGSLKVAKNRLARIALKDVTSCQGLEELLVGQLAYVFAQGEVTSVAKVLVDAGLIVLVAVISPFEVDRQRARSIFAEGDFIEVFVDTPVDVCISRDPKGLYKKAAKGDIPNFTGVGQDYERPTKPEITIDGTADLDASVSAILKVAL